MTTKLNGDDICLLNMRVISPDREISRMAQKKLQECVAHPECFADAIAEDWARKIVRRIAGNAQRTANT